MLRRTTVLTTGSQPEGDTDMLHIKDIEAFAHINEALARQSDSKTPEGGADGERQRPAVHPALLLAMVATGRLKPTAEDAAGADGAPNCPPDGATDKNDERHHPASLAGMMARMMNPRFR